MDEPERVMSLLGWTVVAWVWWGAFYIRGIRFPSATSDVFLAVSSIPLTILLLINYY